MPASVGKNEVFNMALGFAGCRQIGSPDERTPEAIQCALHWDRVRRGVLRDHPWAFATERRTLAQTDMPEAYSKEWRYSYGMPDPALRIVAVHSGAVRNRRAKEPFAVVRHDGQQIILSDVPSAVCDCIVDVQDLSAWDELAIMAAARRLAAAIAVALLRNNGGKVTELQKLAQMEFPDAAGVDAAEQRIDRPDLDSWLAARG